MSLSITTARLTIGFICVIFVLQVCCVSVQATGGPDQAVNMAEALKYLQALDKYYSQVARPRPLMLDSPRNDPSMEDRGDKLKLLHLLHLDRRYSRLARPRFGRSLAARSPNKYMTDEAEANMLYEKRRR